MTILIGDGFHLITALGASGAAANGTVISASDLGQVTEIQTDSNLAGSNNQMHAGDGFIVDTNNDGDFSDEIATTQADNDRYTSSTVTYADGSTSSVTLELVTLSDGTQAILFADASADRVNAASDQIQSITLGNFNTRFDNRYHQGNFTNTVSNSVVCFCETTQVVTPAGEQMIGTLSAGDEVITAHAGTQKILWIGKSKLSSAQLVASPHLRPVRIRAGALGEGFPKTDLLVSPQHRMLIVSEVAKRMFGQMEILVPAFKLVGADGIEQVTSVAPITYVHILLETHQIIFSNGALAESLYPGPQALQSLSDNARKEIYEIFPELEVGDQVTPFVRPTVQRQALVNKLLERHQKNCKSLVQ